MRTINSLSARASAACVALALGCAIGPLTAISAQQPAPGAQAGRGGRGGRGGGAAVFTASDTNKDGAVTRDEFKATFDGWYTTWDSAKSGALTREQLTAGLAAALPPPPPQPPNPAACGGSSSNPQLACPADVEKMMAALPDTAPAKPQRPRHILVLGRAAGFVHSSIPLAAKFVEAAGTKTGAWKTTISYNAADINTYFKRAAERSFAPWFNAHLGGRDPFLRKRKGKADVKIAASGTAAAKSNFDAVWGKIPAAYEPSSVSERESATTLAAFRHEPCGPSPCPSSVRRAG